MSGKASSTGERSDSAAAFPPHVLREYALLADGERGILVGPRGDYVWMCAPGWDSDPVFSALIGGGGIYAVTPTDPRFVWGGYYENGTLIWHSRWVTSTGIIECREALTFPGDAHTAVILRRVIAVDGRARVRVVLDPRAEFGKRPMTNVKHPGGRWTARSGRLYLRWSGARPAKRVADGSLTLDLEVDPGAHHDLVFEVGEHGFTDPPPSAQGAWDATEAAWNREIPQLSDNLAPTDARHAYTVLRGLTTAGGGMVAAATMCLPERARAGRNYDYRYAWIRDQCYTGQAIAAAHPSPLLDDAVAFIAGRILAD
ncbi:MAG TPA: trehalase-like domain-containing protein, partial [Acidimicrobiales bacterium]